MSFDVSMMSFEAIIKWFFVLNLSFEALIKWFEALDNPFDKNSDTIDVARVTSESARKCGVRIGWLSRPCMAGRQRKTPR